MVLQDENCTLKEINQTLSSFANTYSTPLDMFLAGYKYEEIALFMDLPIGTVKSRIFYARKRLQILLKDYRDDYSNSICSKTVVA